MVSQFLERFFEKKLSMSESGPQLMLHKFAEDVKGYVPVEIEVFVDLERRCIAQRESEEYAVGGWIDAEGQNGMVFRLIGKPGQRTEVTIT